jgi:hypothetical protein
MQTMRTLLSHAIAFAALLLPAAVAAHPIDKVTGFGSYKLDPSSNIPPSQADLCLANSFGAVLNTCPPFNSNPPSVILFYHLPIQTDGSKPVVILTPAASVVPNWSVNPLPTCTAYVGSYGAAAVASSPTVTLTVPGAAYVLPVTVPSAPVNDLYVSCTVYQGQGIAEIYWPI